MKAYSKISLRDFPIVLIFIFIFINDTSIGQTVIETVNGKMDGKANLIISGQQAKSFPIGEVFTSGTTFETIAEEVRLGANGNSQLLNPHTRHKIRFIGGKEMHTTTKGKVKHDVTIPKSHYKISTHVVDGYSDNTEFEVEVVGNMTRIKTIKGTVNTFQKVPLKLKTSDSNNKGPKNGLNSTVFKSIKEGQELEFYKPTPIPSGTVQDALNVFTQQLRQHEQLHFPEEQLADDNALVGELYLDLEDPNAAIPYFNKAIMYYERFDFAELDIAEMNLNLAEAYYLLGMDDKFISYGNKAISLLLLENEFNKEDLYFANMDGDDYTVELIEEDLYFNYYNIGWVYDISGDDDNADYYYEQAENYK